MKIYFLLPLLFVSHTISAQLSISTGSQLVLAGNAQLTLQNTDFISNGNFVPGNGSVIFNGNNSAKIDGSQPIQFFDLSINTQNNNAVVLRRDIGVSHDLLFSSGFFNLNGFNTDLGSTGRLINENENSRFIGTNGGQVVATAVLNGPQGENPGNLGAVITSTQNLGNTTVRRGHQTQNGNGLATSILRYFDIIPAGNINLDASLQINYFDGELNGLDESTLSFFKTDDGVNWTGQGFSSRDTSTNFVAKTNISSFSRWTLSSNSNTLPVLFTLFNAKCTGNSVSLTWKTAQEQNSDHFDIEKSIDGNHWDVIGRISAAGNSSIESTYSFTDNSPGQKTFYRVAEYDIDGRAQHTFVLTTSCSLMDEFSLWPNPSHDVVYINIVTGNDSQATISIFDNKGALVKMQKASLLQGNNQIKVDLTSLVTGVYFVLVDWNHGQLQKTIQILKQ